MSKIEFENWDELQAFVSNQIAQFVRDNMHELNNAPTDYNDHYQYIIDTYEQHLNRLSEDDDTI